MYAKSPNMQSKMLLKEFLKTNLKKFSKNNMYMIIVSGQLDFEQDFIHSKIPVTQSVKSKITNLLELEVDQQAIEGNFLLLRKEIINGGITKSTLDILKKVCTSNELKEIYNLEVETALFYYDEDCITDIEEFLNAILLDKGFYSFDLKTSQLVDTCCFKTFLFPIKGFVEPLINERLMLKSQKTMQWLKQNQLL